jgi:hypothetical protein
VLELIHYSISNLTNPFGLQLQLLHEPVGRSQTAIDTELIPQDRLDIGCGAPRTIVAQLENARFQSAGDGRVHFWWATATRQVAQAVYTPVAKPLEPYMRGLAAHAYRMACFLTTLAVEHMRNHDHA